MDRHPRLSLGIGPVIAATRDSATADSIAMLGVLVKAGPRSSLPILGLPLGPPPNRAAEGVSALIRFMHPETETALLPQPTAGIWVREGHAGLPETDPARQIDSTMATGESLLLLIAAKVAGESDCYGLEITMTEGLLNSDLLIAEPEITVQIDLAAERLSARARFQLQNPGAMLETFLLTAG